MQQSMRDLSRWIRDYGHDSRHLTRLMANIFVWHQIWTAMDIIDDVDFATAAYISSEFPTEPGERYLRIYGALQGLFLQQDALCDLIKAIHPAKDIRPNDLLKDIRGARNASIGHPTRLRRGGTLSTHGIVQHSITKEGFDLFSYPTPNEKLFQHIPVRELIEKQRQEAFRILSEVVSELREQDRAHREQFKDVKLVRAFENMGYAFEKIFEEVRHNSTPVLSGWAVDHLRQSLEDFERLLRGRGLNIETCDSIKYRYEDIQHPLVELGKFLRGEESEVASGKSAVVFADALRGYFEELRHMAAEIDEQYESEPEPIDQSE